MGKDRARRNGGVKAIRGEWTRERGYVGLKDETKEKGAKMEVRLRRVVVVNAYRGPSLGHTSLICVVLRLYSALRSGGGVGDDVEGEGKSRMQVDEGKKRKVRNVTMGRSRMSEGEQVHTMGRNQGVVFERGRKRPLARRRQGKAQLPVETLKLAGGEWGGEETKGQKRGKSNRPGNLVAGSTVAQQHCSGKSMWLLGLKKDQ